jgi:hypothetical protein
LAAKAHGKSIETTVRHFYKDRKEEKENWAEQRIHGKRGYAPRLRVCSRQIVKKLPSPPIKPEGKALSFAYQTTQKICRTTKRAPPATR